MNAQAKFYRPVQEILVLSAFALKRRDANEVSGQIVYTSSCDLGTYHICEQQKTRRACTFAQSRQIMFDFFSFCE